MKFRNRATAVFALWLLLLTAAPASAGGRYGDSPRDISQIIEKIKKAVRKLVVSPTQDTLNPPKP